MHHFFVQPENIGETHIQIQGQDVNHIGNVLRLKVDDPLILNDGEGIDYLCLIEALTNESIRCKIQSVSMSKSELPIQVTLYQGTPKQDKMESIVQKCVELGIYNIATVQMRRSIVKYDAKKSTKKVQRWNGIAEAAAKQSKRGRIPKVRGTLSWEEMIVELHNYECILVPYENACGMAGTREALKELHGKKNVAVLIGPEGGFDPDEIEQLIDIDGSKILSLGNRILRTETAGMAFMSMLVYEIEEAH